MTPSEPLTPPPALCFQHLGRAWHRKHGRGGNTSKPTLQRELVEH